MKYYLIAGERSGDLHGSNLIRSLRRIDREARFRCWGGDEMEKAGADLIVHYREMAVMGLVEVVENLPKFFKYLRFCKKDIRDYQPDVVILIDFAGFNLRIAKFVYRNNIRVFYYISPKVWAWNSSRVEKIKSFVHRMYVILPFEVDFYRKFGYQVKFIGNPVQDSVNLHRLNSDFVDQNRLPENKPLIALLPGSRTQELASMMPLMREVAKKYPHYHFVVAAIKSVDKVMYDPVKYLGNVSLVYEQTYDLLAFADAAVVTSGTATLETALFDVPQVVVYRTNAISYAIGRWLVKVDFISLVNLIAGRQVIQEFLQGQMSVENVAAELEKLVEDKNYRSQIIKGYQEMKEKLGDRNASQEAARLMFRDLKKEPVHN